MTPTKPFYRRAKFVVPVAVIVSVFAGFTWLITQPPTPPKARPKPVVATAPAVVKEPVMSTEHVSEARGILSRIIRLQIGSALSQTDKRKSQAPTLKVLAESIGHPMTQDFSGLCLSNGYAVQAKKEVGQFVFETTSKPDDRVMHIEASHVLKDASCPDVKYPALSVDQDFRELMRLPAKG